MSKAFYEKFNTHISASEYETTMSSVTQRVKAVKQPRGGYVNPKLFESVEFDDGYTLKEENISPILIGLTVEYMTSVILWTKPDDAFLPSFLGSLKIKKPNIAEELLSKIKGLDPISIRNACKLTGFDVCYRGNPLLYKPVEDIEADEDTVENIIIMVKRSVNFFNEYGPVVLDGPKFPGGYTDKVTDGDGDFVTKDTVWEFKVSKNEPSKNHTLQLLMCYLMGHRSTFPELKNVDSIGIFNPRLNKVYQLQVSKIDKEIVNTVEKDVIGYDFNW